MRNQYIQTALILSLAFVMLLGGTNANVFAFSLPRITHTVGESVFIEDIDLAHFYAVFLPFEFPTQGELCASITGEELVEDNNLRHYGTCFINDPGVFTVVELGEPVHASFWDTKSSDYFISERTVVLKLPVEAVEPTGTTE